MLRLENYVVREKVFHSESYKRKQCRGQSTEYKYLYELPPHVGCTPILC
jgi:hypothetical protein